MNNYKKELAEQELRRFTAKNFERPGKCRNSEQIRFYVRELCLKIEEMEACFNYVPEWAYSLLAQYNARQNSMLHRDFRNTYTYTY